MARYVLFPPNYPGKHEKPLRGYKMKFSKIVSIFAVFTILILVTAFAAQNSKEGKSQSAVKPQPQTTKKMMQQCESMMAMHQKIQINMKAMDEELEKLVAAMNKAPEGNKKMDAMAAVLTKMLEQRKAMREEMMNMQVQDMQHMGEHIQMGQNSMATCPMMKGNMGK